MMRFQRRWNRIGVIEQASKQAMHNGKRARGLPAEGPRGQEEEGGTFTRRSKGCENERN